MVMYALFFAPQKENLDAKVRDQEARITELEKHNDEVCAYCVYMYVSMLLYVHVCVVCACLCNTLYASGFEKRAHFAHLYKMFDFCQFSSCHISTFIIAT